MPNPWTSEYDDDDWESLLAQLIIGGASLYHPTAVAAEPSWVPTDLDNCVLWLPADYITGLSDGDPVGTFSDQSGNGYDFTQSVGAAKPTYNTNVLNGEAVVSFDGGDTLDRTHTEGLECAGTGISVFLVIRNTDAGAAGDFFFAFLGDTDKGWVVSFDILGGDKFNFYTKGGSWDAYDSGPVVNTWYIQEAVINAAGAASYFVNGVADGTAVGATIPDSANATPTLGGAAVAGWTFTGQIAEFIVYNTNLSSDDRALVETYLNDKYAIY